MSDGVDGGRVAQGKLCGTVGHTVEGGVVTQAQLRATVGHTMYMNATAVAHS